jgi:hypothetical protein
MAVLAVLTLSFAVQADAQSAADQTNSPQQLGSVADPGVQVPPSPIPTVQTVQLKQPYWSSSAGFEADTHNTGYGYFGPQYSKPVTQNLALIAGGNVNYLYYEYPSGGSLTNVHSPGVSLRGGVKIGDHNYLELGAGPSVKRRHTEVRDISNNVASSFDDTLVGVNMGADLSVDPTKHNNVYGILDYSTQDDYLWSRLAYKEQVSNRDWSRKVALFVGVEGVAQGNTDVRSTQFGPLFEVVHVPSTISIMLRGGWKRSTYQVGPDKTGPWFAIGFWRRL